MLLNAPILIPAGNPSEWTGPSGNNTWLLPGREPALVDAGVGHAEHVEALAAALNGAPLVRVLITHWHPDHVKGLPALRDRWPGLVVVDAAGDPVPAGDGQLEIVPTPGHSPDHLCFFDREAGDLYCGDLARKGGTIVIPAQKGGRPAGLPRVAGARARARPAPPAAWARPDRRRSGGAHRRVHRAPRRSASSRSCRRFWKGRGRWTTSCAASIRRCPRRSAPPRPTASARIWPSSATRGARSAPRA